MKKIILFVLLSLYIVTFLSCSTEQIAGYNIVNLDNNIFNHIERMSEKHFEELCRFEKIGKTRELSDKEKFDFFELNESINDFVISLSPEEQKVYYDTLFRLKSQQ